jgi:putative membrane protein
MTILSNILVGLVALIHLYIVWLEMFVWTTRGKKVFKNFPKDLFEPTKTLAANQGLYNGFLAAGLIWSFFISDPIWKDYIRLFFLSCVAVAGIYGALTADKKILFVQTVPAVLGIVFIFLS